MRTWPEPLREPKDHRGRGSEGGLQDPAKKLTYKGPVTVPSGTVLQPKYHRGTRMEPSGVVKERLLWR